MGRTIPIIAMTANAFSEDVKDCLDAGMDAPAAKPLDTAVLERPFRSLPARDFRTKESYQEIQIAPMRQRPHGGSSLTGDGWGSRSMDGPGAGAQLQGVRVNQKMGLLRPAQVVYGAIHRIPTAGGGIVDGNHKIRVVDRTHQGLLYSTLIIRMGNGGKMGALLQQGKIPIPELRRPFGGDFFMWQEALQKQRGIVMAEQVEDFSGPEPRTGIGNHIEAAIARPAKELELL